ncbi:MAG: hypothetical protein QOH90_971 [Actinomycetota bacterium]|nr:hypothetical protein [Actinomycetota bacterium]
MAVRVDLFNYVQLILSCLGWDAPISADPGDKKMSKRLIALIGSALLVLTTAVMSGASEGGKRSYIVVFKNSVSDPGSARNEQARANGASVKHVFKSVLKGYSAEMSDAAAARIASDPRVDYVEADQAMHAVATQSNPTWGLDRIDQRNLPLNASYTYDTTGAGVTAYIIDTGIRFTHSEFGGRASSGVDEVDGGAADDCNGHGTHVAGTVGGATYGVAKSVNLVAVRVLDCSGSGFTSGVIAGIDWVTVNHQAGAPAVANMSLGGGASASLDSAIQNSINDGVTYAVAAGNGDNAGRPLDACGGSPARVGAALTVGATDRTDTKASWSNYGTCVDLFAPGVSITSSWLTSDTSTNTISGTSMATPHVAGAAALYLESHTAATPADVATALKTNATSGLVKSAGTGSPNLLLYIGTASGGGGGGGGGGTTGITLTTSAGPRGAKGMRTVNLTWSGASPVDVYRNGTSFKTVTGSSTTDSVKGGTYTYKVCAAGTSTCSNDSTITV